MEQQFSEELTTLKDLGLTLIQAKVYLTLFKLGPSKTSVIAAEATVARPDVYRNLIKLQKLGLVEKSIETPTRHKALPLNQGLSLLLERRTAQFKDLRAKTKILLARAKTAKIKNPKNRDQSLVQFILTPSGLPVTERIKTAIVNAKQNIDLVLSWKSFACWMLDTFAESMEIAWTKHVETRFIIERPFESETEEELLNFCRKKPSCQIRFMQHQPKISLGIYDKKEVSIMVDPMNGLTGSPVLWSNNDSLLYLAEDYFEVHWRTAIKNTY